MIRNDYRRALILLRSAVKGMSGHVRLERRTLGGSMRFSVAGAGAKDNLRAFLLRKGKNGWAATAMGALHVDNRGQAGLTWTFDPRNIEGYTLEEYPVVAVVQLGKNGAVEPAMSGFLGSSTEVDWVQAMSAARALYRRPADQSTVEAKQAAPETESPAGVEPVGGLPEALPGETGTEAQPEAPEEQPEGAQSVEEAPSPAETQPEAPEAQTPETGEASRQPACLIMALDINTAWPETVEPLRMLFQQLPACSPFPADGYTFVCAPLPGNGQAYSLVGVRVEEERPVSVCYGIPGTFAPEPPAGLDGYMWRGSGVNGWWVTFVDALTGEEVPE